MAIGQIITVQSGTSQLITAKSHSEVQSLGVLNPNDGIVYIKLNGPATFQTPEYDWKLPSQSYGLFPGPWQSVGLYYQDESGTARSGDIDVYESDIQQPDIPAIVAIGRAVQGQSSAMDVVQGPQPGNPGAGVSRLWVDPSGHLNILQPNGTNYGVIDTNNLAANVGPVINNTALGGDLFGTVSNGHIGVQYGGQIGLRIANGTFQPHIQLDGSGNVMLWASGGAGFRWVNQANSLQWMALDTSANLNVANNIQASGGTYYIGDQNHGIVNSGGNLIYLSSVGHQHFFWETGSPATNATVNMGTANINGNAIVSGVTQTNPIYFIDNQTQLERWNPGQLRMPSGGGLMIDFGSQTPATLQLNGGSGGGGGPYIQWNYSGFWLGSYNGGLIMSGPLIYFSNNGGLYLQWTGSYFYFYGGSIMTSGGYLYFQGSGSYYLASASGNMTIGGSALWIAGNCGVQGVGPGYGFQAPNSAAAYGQGYANAWINASSRKFKDNIQPLDNPIAIVLNPELHAVQYDHTWDLREKGIPNSRNDPLFGTAHSIGFVADDWLPHVPEIVAVDENGEAEGMDYARVTCILWEAVKEFILDTNQRLEWLEQHTVPEHPPGRNPNSN